VGAGCCVSFFRRIVTSSTEALIPRFVAQMSQALQKVVFIELPRHLSPKETGWKSQQRGIFIFPRKGKQRFVIIPIFSSNL
jgi:hypothetical protein